MKPASSAGCISLMSAPSSSSRALISGCCNILLISPLSRRTIASGVPRGATNPTPVQTGLGLDFHWNWLNHRPVLWTVLVVILLVGTVYFLLVQRTKPAHTQAPEEEVLGEFAGAPAAKPV